MPLRIALQACLPIPHPGIDELTIINMKPIADCCIAGYCVNNPLQANG